MSSPPSVSTVASTSPVTSPAIGHVGAPEVDLARCAEFVGCRGEWRLVPRADHDPGTLVDEGPSDRTADSSAGAGDEHTSVIEFQVHICLLIVRSDRFGSDPRPGVRRHSQRSTRAPRRNPPHGIRTAPDMIGPMEQVRRMDDDELCGHVDARDGTWCSLTVFGAELGRHATRADAVEQVLAEGLASLAERWTLRRGANGEEEVVCIQEANPDKVTVAVGVLLPARSADADDHRRRDLIRRRGSSDADRRRHPISTRCRSSPISTRPPKCGGRQRRQSSPGHRAGSAARSG